jgi:hypothetical protein
MEQKKLRQIEDALGAKDDIIIESRFTKLGPSAHEMVLKTDNLTGNSYITSVVKTVYEQIGESFKFGVGKIRDKYYLTIFD